MSFEVSEKQSLPFYQFCLTGNDQINVFLPSFLFFRFATSVQEHTTDSCHHLKKKKNQKQSTVLLILKVIVWCCWSNITYSSSPSVITSVKVEFYQSAQRNLEFYKQLQVNHPTLENVFYNWKAFKTVFNLSSSYN